MDINDLSLEECELFQRGLDDLERGQRTLTNNDQIVLEKLRGQIEEAIEEMGV